MHTKYILATLFFFSFLGSISFAEVQLMTIQVKTAKLRQKPNYFSKVTANLPYNTQVKLLKNNNFWYKVTTNNKTGWLHASELTDKKINLHATSQKVKVKASREELGLAGKGFNKKIEKKYRNQNKQADFVTVEIMEKLKISEKQLRRFMKLGKTGPWQEKSK